ncbi:MAG TPA: ATP-binding protein [Candidatus Polarisedimenticolia bacterium]|nr:ATP-binding protein [Candidatus Polarisedimenticolia bacterium]
MPRRGGISLRIAIAAVSTSVVAVVILTAGVMVAGGDAFKALMVEQGSSTAEAAEMFDTAVRGVVAISLIVAVAAAVALAIVLARRLATPLHSIGRAARRIADGDYAARVPRDGPEEVASLADSFNQMAVALEEQERMRRDFITNAAHELKTPLTNLTGYLEALRDGVIPAEAATYDSLLEETERLVRLSSELDVLAAGDAELGLDEIRDLDLGQAIHAAVDLATAAAVRSELSLEAEVPQPLAARANPDRLAQVLGNLLHNAIRYTPAGGRILVRAERRPGDVLVTVSNTGPGIPEEDLPRVFERFYRVDKSRDRALGGAGIGLAIVRQLVEAMGGRVGAASNDGLTQFWFSLPA